MIWTDKGKGMRALWRESGEKRCSDCGLKLPVSSFYFYRELPQSYCKKCSCKRSNDRAKRRISAKPDRKYERSPQAKANHAARSRAWYQKNKAHHAAWKLARRQASPALQVKERITKAIAKALRGSKKMQPTFDYLGYTPQELMVHLERQFVKGMGWHNMGEWHIDHIVPFSCFSIESRDDPELRRSFALTNLRPLWAKENIAKSDKRLFLI